MLSNAINCLNNALWLPIYFIYKNASSILRYSFQLWHEEKIENLHTFVVHIDEPRVRAKCLKNDQRISRTNTFLQHLTMTRHNLLIMQILEIASEFDLFSRSLPLSNKVIWLNRILCSDAFTEHNSFWQTQNVVTLLRRGKSMSQYNYRVAQKI